MANLETKYLGLELKNPLVASASPLSKNLDGIRRLEEAGAGAIVMFSLFEEQIQYDSSLLNEVMEQGTESFAESLSFLPDMEHFSVGPEPYLELLSKAKAATNIPIIASLNGCSKGGWVEYAKEIAQAGADALEINLYRLPTSPDLASDAFEKSDLEVVRAIRKAVKIPVAVKLSPFYTSLPHFVKAIEKEKANGIVLFNRFYQADIDLDNLEVVPKVNYSTSSDLLLPLRWSAILSSQTKMDLAITSGVHSAEDAIKGLMSGAAVTMLASELLNRGVRRLSNILEDMYLWMDEHEYKNVEQLRGCMSLKNVSDPQKYERAQYLRVLDSYKPAQPTA